METMERAVKESRLWALIFRRRRATSRCRRTRSGSCRWRQRRQKWRWLRWWRRFQLPTSRRKHFRVCEHILGLKRLCYLPTLCTQ